MGVAAGLVVGATACTDDNSDAGTVVSITDGDTLVASINGKDQTVRLLNIDTPETKDPNKPVECLGAEATDFLAGLLPVGSSITLMYDVERTDRYERTLAAVFTPDEKFVSAEIARAGLGTAVSFGQNTKFLPPVEEAEQEAKAGAAGIHDADVECTLPAQLEAANSALATTAGEVSPSTAAAAGAAVTASATAIAGAKTLLAALNAGAKGADVVRWAAFTDAELAGHITQLSGGVGKAETRLASLAETKKTLAAAEKAAAEKAAAEKAAAEKAAAEAAAEKAAAWAAAAQAEAERVAAEAATAAEAERIRNLPPVYVPPAPAPYVPPAVQPPAQNSGGGYPGYTGPRCYLPGGKSYRPC